MSEIIDLGAVRQARAAPRPRSYRSPEAALAAMRGALDTLADACLAAGEFWPTSAGEWASIAKAGLNNRLERRAGQ